MTYIEDNEFWLRQTKMEPFCTVCGNLNLFSHSGRLEVSQKNKSTIWISNPTMCMYQEYEVRNLKGSLHLHVYCSIIHYSQDMGITRMCIGGWMDWEKYIYQNIIHPYKTRNTCHLWQYKGALKASG